MKIRLIMPVEIDLRVPTSVLVNSSLVKTFQLSIRMEPGEFDVSNNVT